MKSDKIKRGGLLGGGVVLLALSAGMSAPPAGVSDVSMHQPGTLGNSDHREISVDRVRGRLVALRDDADRALAELDNGRPARDVLRSFAREHEWLARFSDARRPSGFGAPSDPTPLNDEGARSLVKEHLPDLYERLSNPNAAFPGVRSSAMDRIANRVQRVLADSEGDAELRDLMLAELRAGAEVFDAVRGIREASRLDEAAQTDARSYLESAVGIQLDARYAVARAELARLERRVNHMRDDIDRMDSRRGEEIQRMLERVGRSPERRPGDRRERGGRDHPSRDG